jgi:hypothetical protein
MVSMRAAVQICSHSKKSCDALRTDNAPMNRATNIILSEPHPQSRDGGIEAARATTDMGRC